MLLNFHKHRNFEHLLLLLITILGAALRFFKVNDWSFWIDELYTLQGSLQEPSSIIHQPYFLITKFVLSNFGNHALLLRFPATVFGILCIPILYFPLKGIFNKSAALLAVFLIAISPWHIYLSQLARWYPLLLLSSAGSIFAFYYFIEKNSIKYLILSITLFLFAFWLHLTAGFVLIIIIGYLLFLLVFPVMRPPNFKTKNVKLTLSLMFFGALFALPKFFSFVKLWASLKQVEGYWGSTPVIFTLKALYQLTPSIGIIFLAGIILLLHNKDRKGLFFALYCLLPPLILSLVALFEVNISVKYIFFTLPGILAVVSYLCLYVTEHLKPQNRFIGAAIFLAVIVPSLQTNYLYYTIGHGNRDRLREAVQYIHQNIAAGDQIYLHYLFYDQESSQFYFKKTAEIFDLNFKKAEFITPKSPEDIDKEKKVWVLTIGQPISINPSNFDKWIVENTNLFAEFPAIRGSEDKTIRVYIHKPSSGRSILAGN